MALRIAATVLLLIEAVLESLRFGGQYQLQQARAALGARNYAAAIDHARFGEWLVPWNPHFARIEGHVSLELQDAPRAAAALTRSLQINPYYILTHLPLGNTKLILAQQRLMEKDAEAAREALALVGEAEAHARAVLQVCPMYARAESLLARAASLAAALRTASPDLADQAAAVNDWRNAEEHLLRALELGAPTQGELYERLAGVRIALHDMNGAEAALVRGAQTAPDRPEIWAAFLNFANRFGDYDRLRQTLYDQIARIQEEGIAPRPGQTEQEAAQARDRALTDMNLMLANVLENSNGSLEDALAAYDSAIEHGGLRPEVWANYARFARARERWDDFTQDIRAAAEGAREQGAESLAQVTLAHRALVEGVPALEAVTALTLEQVRAYPLGAPLSVGEAWGWVVALLNDVFSTDPAGAGCTSSLNLGMLYAAIKMPEHAEALFQRTDACADDTQRPYLYAHWAQALGAQNRAAEAVSMLRDGVKRYPEAIDLRWAYARTLRASGLMDEARAQYDLLLQQAGLDPRGREMLEAERAAL
jgi:predicted Zn-dependent protease